MARTLGGKTNIDDWAITVTVNAMFMPCFNYYNKIFN